MPNLPIKSTNYCENIYWVCTITLKDDHPKTASQIMLEIGEYKAVKVSDVLHEILM